MKINDMTMYEIVKTAYQLGFKAKQRYQTFDFTNWHKTLEYAAVQYLKVNAPEIFIKE